MTTDSFIMVMDAKSEINAVIGVFPFADLFNCLRMPDERLPGFENLKNRKLFKFSMEQKNKQLI